MPSISLTALLRRALLALVAVVGLGALVIFGLSSFRMSRTVEITDTAPAIPTDSISIARGRYLGTAIGKCVECHGEDLGGKLAIDAGPVATIYGTNLTRGAGGRLATMSDADVVHAIRRGVGPGGRKLLFMPSIDWVGMADEDVAALVAWMRSLPPVDRDTPSSVVKPLGRALYVAGQLPLYDAERIRWDGQPRARPVPGVTAEYGAYLAAMGGCTGCHGPGLSGGQVPGTPPEFKPASNLTPTGIGHYSEADFFRAMREGKRPDGSAIDPFMPWRLAGLMTDDDTRALFAYLRSVPPREFGNR